MSPSQEITIIEDCIIKSQVPDLPGSYPLVLLLHGWTGDENSMWIFGNRVPSRSIKLAPRAFHRSPLGGYSWCDNCQVTRMDLDDLRPAVEKLRRLIRKLPFSQFTITSLHLMGFSQGASVALSWLYLYPEEIKTLVSLSGRLPGQLNYLPADARLKGKPIYWGHGTKDELVPVEHARNGVSQLQAAGADVLYCEDEVGHKISASCFRGMEDYYKDPGVMEFFLS